MSNLQFDRVQASSVVVKTLAEVLPAAIEGHTVLWVSDAHRNSSDTADRVFAQLAEMGVASVRGVWFVKAGAGAIYFRTREYKFRDVVGLGITRTNSDDRDMVELAEINNRARNNEN